MENRSLYQKHLQWNSDTEKDTLKPICNEIVT